MTLFFSKKLTESLPREKNQKARKQREDYQETEGDLYEGSLHFHVWESLHDTSTCSMSFHVYLVGLRGNFESFIDLFKETFCLLLLSHSEKGGKKFTWMDSQTKRGKEA